MLFTVIMRCWFPLLIPISQQRTRNRLQ